MTDHDDAALDRLRAADPARVPAVDLTRLRAAVDARIAAEEGGDGVAPVTDLTRAPSRRMRWLRVAGAAAGAVLIGSVGFGLGNGALLGRSGADEGLGATTSGAQEEGSAPAGGAPLPEIAGDGGAGSTDALQPDASRGIWPGWGERQTFRPEGLPNESGSAVTWAFDGTDAFTAERVREVAAAVGLEGEPELRDGSWTVGSLDGTAAYLTVYPDGQAGMSFYDPEADPWNCQAVREGTAAQCPDLGDAPGDTEAIERTGQLLVSLGFASDMFEFEVSKDEGAGWISVTANQLIDGRRTGTAWWVSFTGAGVQSLSGSLATLVELGDYPVVGAADAVARITDPRFGTIGGFSILAAARGGAVLEGDVAESGIAPEEAAPTAPPIPPAPGTAVPWPVEDVAITAAVLGLAQWTTADGAALLVPAWELSAADGRVWTVLALAEEALDTAPMTE